jgi:hypothetical protein
MKFMGRKTQSLAGQRFGRLLVLDRVPREPRASGQAKWRCLCDCENISIIGSNALRSGATQSCGCLRRDALVTRNTTHGLSGTRTYNSWCNMIRRCTHDNDPRYPEWGGRGITVCERWLDYPNFLADMGERPPGTTLDREDNDGNYEPGNCRWATPPEQMANRRNTVR